jgi:hypothetical protein
MKTLVEIMAQSVGARPQQNKNCDVEYLMSVESLERFAEFIRADEREACAQFLESTNLAGLPEDTALHYARLLKGFAEGIRARSNT